jgi:Uma2 family endonuclease
VEVVSPTDVAEQLQEKIAEYFQAGVLLVWVVYPQRQQVHVYESLSNIRGLSRTAELDGGVVLPGFRLPLSELFLESAANGPAP